MGIKTSHKTKALLHPTEGLCAAECRHADSLKDRLSQSPFSLFLQPIPSLKTPAGFRLRALTLLGQQPRPHLSLPTHNLELLSNDWIVKSQGHRKMPEEEEAPPTVCGKKSSSSFLSFSSLDATTPEELKASPCIVTPVESPPLDTLRLTTKISRLPVLCISSSKGQLVCSAIFRFAKLIAFPIFICCYWGWSLMTLWYYLDHFFSESVRIPKKHWNIFFKNEKLL